MSNKVGVVVGRFQIDELSAGHIALLSHVVETCSQTLILLGIRPAEASDTNPLGFVTRSKMIKDRYPSATILPVSDMRNDEEWSKSVDQLIQLVYGYGVHAEFHVGRDSFVQHYTGQYDIVQHTFGPEIMKISARDKRQSIRDMELINANMRRGAIQATMNIPHRFTMMVDMFLTRTDGKESYKVLVGKKQFENKWRLPGGHVDAGESFRAAASRELAEETGMYLTDGQAGWKIVGDFNVPDWRVRDTDLITYKTILMVGQFSWGKTAAETDFVEVDWLPVEDIKNSVDSLIVDEHHHLMTAAIKYLEKNPPQRFEDTGTVTASFYEEDR